MEEGPDRSTIEIKHLLHKLHPRGAGGHKDRVRVLTRFRNYVAGVGTGTKKNNKITTPEFYDDDLPLLFLGSESQDGLYDDDTQYGDLSKYYGILQACSTPSTDHAGGLKRSARNAMNLLKYLVCEHIDLEDGEPTSDGIDAQTGLPELNPFAYSLCQLPPEQLRLANFDAHIKAAKSGGNDGAARSGAKDDSCAVLVVLLTRCFDPSDTNVKIALEDLLTTPQARQSFENWMVKNVQKGVINSIKRNEGGGIPSQITSESPARGSISNPFGEVELEIDNVLDAFQKRPDNESDENKKAEAMAEAHAEEQLDELGIKLYKKNDVDDNDGSSLSPPYCWKDSALAKRQIQLTVAEGVTANDVDKEDDKWSKRILERQKLIGRDPLGIRPDTFDITNIKDRAVNVLQGFIEDIEEEIQDVEAERPMESTRKKKKDKYAYSAEQLISLEAQKEALENILHGDMSDGGEAKRPGAENLSLLPSDANFDSLMFLTLLHRNASYEELQASIEKLENKTDNQTQRIQNLIRENFELFIRCADGIDLFSEKAGRSKQNDPGVNDWLDRLDSLAQSTSDNAKKSFKPLLDNTNEVRKVQSALAVLQRVGPLLQVPNLMRQHIENGRFSAAVSEYRRAIAIDDNNKIQLLSHVKLKAAEAARDARIDLETRLANPSLPVHTVLDSIKSLSELIELDIPPAVDNQASPPKTSSNEQFELLEVGKYLVGGVTVDVRAYPPSLACLLLQAAHFAKLVKEAVEQTETTANRIFGGESLAAVTEEDDDYTFEEERNISSNRSTDTRSSDKRERIRWKYDVLESRVLAAIRVVAIASSWLPRLWRIAEAARQAEMRLAARAIRRKIQGREVQNEYNDMTAFEVFITNICPSITLLVEHSAFCALGYSEESHETRPTYGMKDTDERLQKIISSPLPAVQSSRCATELARLADVVQSVANSALSLRPSENDYDFGPSKISKTSHFQRGAAMESTLEKISLLMEETVVVIERRKCIFACDQCMRSCSMRASGSGVFDGNAVVSCVQKLSEELTRPEHCADEIEKSCELIMRRSCEGLASYVKDRGDTARLRAVSECASALNESIVHVVREVSHLTNAQCANMEEALVDDVMALENQMFDEFLESIRQNMSTYTKFGPMMVTDDEDEFVAEKQRSEAQFPAHLSASLLAIVRCRAQVERTLGLNTIRKCQAPSTYQFLALSTASDSVVDGVCYEMSQRLPRMRGYQADQYLTELQFLINTLKKFLSDDVKAAAENCKNKLLSKLGGYGQGPDGLGAIERLERLGRVYVMCLCE